MKRNRIILCLLAVLLVSGCARLGLYALNFPGADDVRVVEDVPFGKESWQTLDIYRPKAQDRDLDVIVFFYGGRWSAGDKRDFAFVGNALARKGFLVIVPNYRKYPQVRFPVFVEDGAKAVTWVSDHVRVFGGDPSSINLAGHSAGAHIAAMLTVDKRYLKARGKKTRDVVKSFAGLAGPYAFTPDEEDLQDMFGPPSRYKQMQATTFVDGKEPPMLLLWGGQDDTVEQPNIDRVMDKVAEKRGCAKARIYPSLGHISILTNLSWFGSDDTDIAQDLTTFFRDPKAICR